MSNMTIEVDFLAGTGIEDAINEAREKALEMDVAYVKFRFNGVSFSIGRNADVESALDMWNHGSCPLGIIEA